VSGRRWRVNLSVAAERDLFSILQWTGQIFGTKQALVYEETIAHAVTALAAGPKLPDSRTRDDISPGMWVLHIARRGRKGRHLLVYYAVKDGEIIVVRILHDSMDLARHVPRGDEP
jgi:toxin ParE1/3/4